MRTFTGSRFATLGVRAACHLVALVWLAHIALASLVVVFRAVKNAGIAAAIQFDDIPLLRYFDTHYDNVFNWLMLSGLPLLGVVCGGVWWRMKLGNPNGASAGGPSAAAQRSSYAFLFAFILFEACLLRASQPYESASSLASVDGVTTLDWAAVFSLGIAVWCLPVVLTAVLQPDASQRSFRDLSGPRTSRVFRNGFLYVFGCGAVFFYAWRDHLKFWNPKQNGGYNYAQFFLEEELPQARLVLYSTSVLFATLAAIGGCVLIAAFRFAARRASVESPSRDANSGRLLVLLSAFTWAGMLHLPWMVKLWPEIEAERGWIMPTVTILFTAASLLPALQIGWLSLARDFRELAEDPVFNATHSNRFVPRPSELALWNFVLFPGYPVLSWIRVCLPERLGNGERAPRVNPAGVVLYALLMLAAGAAIFALTWVAYKANTLYKFDDWRGMMKSGLFPFLRVSFALLSACWAYLLLRRIVVLGVCGVSRLVRREALPAERVAAWLSRAVVLLLVGSSLALATWPFWGWAKVNKNVFARAAEYNSRHDFELRFLHWLFDFDRDGFSAVLHGADPDDTDPTVHPGHISPPRDDVPVPIDEFDVADTAKARRAPNVVILFLEGVTREAIYAYGKRTVRGTPHMDRLAAEGTLFTQARCFYPSTWDAWYSTMTGRFLRIKEMDMSRGFGDRYCRYGNFYKVMELAGITRYCQSNVDPFLQICVPMRFRNNPRTAWQPNFDSTVSAEEKKAGIWRGDKRNRRMLEFLDSVEPGERFFMAEHMSDTHFPWNEVDGLQWAGADAVLPNGLTDVKYTNYFQAIARMDKQIGELVDKLKAIGRYDDTMIVVVSDHGCQWWEHEHMYYVSHLYDRCLLVPMIVKMPGIPGGRVVHDPVLQIDLLPTYMQAAGVIHRNPRPDYPFTGRSLIPLMKGTATAAQKLAYRKRDVPLTTHFDKLGVLSEFRHKLIFNRTIGTYKLFDLVNDPQEKKNLADERPELLEAMVEKLRVQIERNPAIIGGIRWDGKTD